MNRFSLRDENGVAYIRNFYKHTHGLQASEKLANYEDEEEQGRIMIGKFPIGTEVWISADCFGEVENAEIIAFTNDKTFIALSTSSDGGWTNDTAWVDNNSVYATHKEATNNANS